MQGSLGLRGGVLWVGRHEMTAHVRAYDLDGAPLDAGFSFRAPDGGRAAVAGLDVDEDRQVWVADGAASSVRVFNLFGAEVCVLEGRSDPRTDAPGVLRELADLAIDHSDEEPLLVVASGGFRRHAVQLYRFDGAFVDSLRPEGDPEGSFEGVRDVTVGDAVICVCEATRGAVQVFRNRAFHYLFRVPMNGNGRFRPIAAAPLADGRIVVAHGGPKSALLLVDSSGRLLRVLAEPGTDPGQVFEPGDVAVEPAGADRGARIAVIDRDGERVQVFTLEGRCYGSFESLPGEVP